MTLGAKQRLMTRLLPRLIDKAYELGYELTLGDAYRDPRLHGDVGIKQGYGAAYSCHKSRLAIDLNLFLDGEYLTSSDDHKPLGEFWEGLHELTCWGGRWNDGNHYSITHEGRK